MFINERHALQKQMEAQGKVVSDLMKNSGVENKQKLEATERAFTELGKKFDQYYKEHWFLGKLVWVFDKIFIAPKSRIENQLRQIQEIKDIWQKKDETEANKIKFDKEEAQADLELQARKAQFKQKMEEFSKIERENKQDLEVDLQKIQAEFEAKNAIRNQKLMQDKMEEMQGEVSKIRGGLIRMQSAVETIGEMLGRHDVQTEAVFSDWRKKAQEFSAAWGEFAKTNNVEELIGFELHGTEATKDEFDRLVQLINKFQSISESARSMIYASAKLARKASLDPELKEKFEELGSEAAKTLTRDIQIISPF
jgi:hypothetical protein